MHLNSIFNAHIITTVEKNFYHIVKVHSEGNKMQMEDKFLSND